MIVSILTRKTAIQDAEEWDKRAARMMERLRPHLERQPGFSGVDVSRDDGGRLVEETRWQSEDDRRRYVRGGAAAMSATIADAILPTAPYPNGTWSRETRED